MLPGGQHGISPTGQKTTFDTFTYYVNLVAHFFGTQGREILDDHCLQDSSCPGRRSTAGSPSGAMK